MKILLNGQNRNLPEATNISGLLESLELTGRFAVAVNRQIIPCGNYQKCFLRPNDQVEIVQAVGGG